ncbi:MAG TPA: HNH endonuclease, partial [Anaeromyxobacteraceae bacterium]|nr:HNH endonuclease [Anaeromyxobacteraceae bacterium]
MHAALPAALDSATLSRRLGELAGDERALQVEFLLHLEEYDRRRAYVDAGHPSLWEFVTRALHYREGAAYRRITAMKALRRVPEAAQALRSGALSLTTLALLEDVLTPENAADVMERSAFKSKRAVEQLVATLRPRAAPKEGLRRLSAAPAAASALPLASPPLAAPPPPAPQVPSLPSDPRVAAPAPPRREVPASLEPVSEDTWSLRVTVDAALKEDLETLIGLLSHKLPRRELHEVVREAVRCAIEKHGKRKGAVEPARKREASMEKPTRREPTAEV